MFRYVFGAQAFIYLALVPLLIERYYQNYDAPMLVGAVAIAALIGGFLIVQKREKSTEYKIAPRFWVAPSMAILALVYCYVSFDFGLTNRRQGSEYMAALFANLPLWALLIVRVYEVLFVPVIVLVFRSEASSLFDRVAVGVSSLMAIPFMGLIDSRGRLLVLALSLLIFFSPKEVLKSLKRSTRFYVGVFLAVGMLYYVSLERAKSYAQASDFFVSEILLRLDGLNLVRMLLDYSEFSLWGKFDWAMFEVLVSKIPFLAEAQYLKLVGKTSTKQYLMQDVIGIVRLDDSNSMVTDPVYFGGLATLAIVFAILGFAIRRFDLVVEQGDLLARPFKAAMMFAFALSFLMIEADFVSAVANIAQIFPIFFLVFWLGCRRVPIDLVRPATSTPKPNLAFASGV